jgi:hypothetical protein
LATASAISIWPDRGCPPIAATATSKADLTFFEYSLTSALYWFSQKILYPHRSIIYKYDNQEFSNFTLLTSRVAVSRFGTAIREEVMPMELIALFSLLVAATTLIIEIIKLWQDHNNH